MTKEQTLQLLLTIAVEFPKDIDPKDTTLLQMKTSLWYGELKDYAFEEIQQATSSALKNLHFCPKLADIFTEIKKIKSAMLPTATQVWASLEQTLIKACDLVGKFPYTYKFNGIDTQGQLARKEARELFDNLSEEVKIFFGNYHIFLQVSICDTYEYEKARFLRIYSDLVERVELSNKVSKHQIIGNQANTYLVEKLDAKANKHNAEEKE